MISQKLLLILFLGRVLWDPELLFFYKILQRFRGIFLTELQTYAKYSFVYWNYLTKNCCATALLYKFEKENTKVYQMSVAANMVWYLIFHTCSIHLNIIVFAWFSNEQEPLRKPRICKKWTDFCFNRLHVSGHGCTGHMLLLKLLPVGRVLQKNFAETSKSFELPH